MQTASPDIDRIYRPRELRAVTGLSVATVWRMRRCGKFPEPVRLSPGACGWTARQIAEWRQTLQPQPAEAR